MPAEATARAGRSEIKKIIEKCNAGYVFPLGHNIFFDLVAATPNDTIFIRATNLSKKPKELRATSKACKKIAGRAIFCFRENHQWHYREIIGGATVPFIPPWGEDE